MAATFQRHSNGRLLLQVDGDGEYVSVLRALWRGEEVPLHGALSRIPEPEPPIYRTGEAADVHLVDSQPPPAAAERIKAAQAPRFGIRLHVITRDTSGQAWAEARRLLAGLEPNVHNGSVHRLLTAHGGSASKLEVYPNLWAGVGLVPGGADLALVGNHAEVANRIEEYHALGIDEFVLSGHPHLEEAYWFGEGVLPLLRERGSWSSQAPTHRMSAV